MHTPYNPYRLRDKTGESERNSSDKKTGWPVRRKARFAVRAGYAAPGQFDQAIVGDEVRQGQKQDTTQPVSGQDGKPFINTRKIRQNG